MLEVVCPTVAVTMRGHSALFMYHTLYAHVSEGCVRVVGPFTQQLSLNIHRACGLHPLNIVLGAVSPIVAVIISWAYDSKYVLYPRRARNRGVCARCGTFYPIDFAENPFS
jgi:hypothetical protein